MYIWKMHGFQGTTMTVIITIKGLITFVHTCSVNVCVFNCVQSCLFVLVFTQMLITPSHLSCVDLSSTGVCFCFADVSSHVGVLSSITIRSHLAESHADLTDSGQKGVCYLQWECQIRCFPFDHVNAS